MKHFDSVTDALSDLQERGFVFDLNLHSDCITCDEMYEVMKPEDFRVREFYHFEGRTDPSENAMVYAIESVKGMKGILLDAKGIYNERPNEEMQQKLKDPLEYN